MPADEFKLKDMRKLMKQFSEQGASVEMASMEESSGQGRDKGFYKATVLEVEEESLLLERPMANGMPIRIKANQTVFCRLNYGRQKISFECKVLCGQLFQKQSGKKVTAVRTTWPKNVIQGQRRNNFRVDMPLAYRSTTFITPINFHDIPSTVPAEWAAYCQLIDDIPKKMKKKGVELPLIKSPRLEAELFDLSACGLGLLVPIIMSRHLKMNDFWWVNLDVPKLGWLNVVAQRMYFVKRTSKRVHAGFKIYHAHHEERAPLVEKMLRDTCHEIEREMLRKRAGGD